MNNTHAYFTYFTKSTTPTKLNNAPDNLIKKELIEFFIKKKKKRKLKKHVCYFSNKHNY